MTRLVVLRSIVMASSTSIDAVTGMAGITDAMVYFLSATVYTGMVEALSASMAVES